MTTVTTNYIINQNQDGSIVFRVNDGGTQANALTISGSDGSLTIGPSYGATHSIVGGLNFSLSSDYQYVAEIIELNFYLF